MAKDWTRLSNPSFLLSLSPYGDVSAFNQENRRRPPLNPGVDVFQTHDVILAEIGAGLNLDQRQRDEPRILQPVHSAKRNVDRLVLAEQLDLAHRW